MILAALARLFDVTPKVKIRKRIKVFNIKYAVVFTLCNIVYEYNTNTFLFTVKFNYADIK